MPYLIQLAKEGAPSVSRLALLAISNMVTRNPDCRLAALKLDVMHLITQLLTQPGMQQLAQLPQPVTQQQQQQQQQQPVTAAAASGPAPAAPAPSSAPAPSGDQDAVPPHDPTAAPAAAVTASLDAPLSDVIERTCILLANLTFNAGEVKQAVEDAGLIQPLTSLLTSLRPSVVVTAAGALSNLVRERGGAGGDLRVPGKGQGGGARPQVPAEWEWCVCACGRAGGRVRVQGCQHALRSEWPFILIVFTESGLTVRVLPPPPYKHTFCAAQVMYPPPSHRL